MDLGVGLFEAHVRDALPHGGLTRHLDHPRGQVHSQRRPRSRQPGGRAGRVPGAAPDIEHLIPGLDLRGVEESAAVTGERPLETLGVSRPILSLGPVPGPGLFGVRRVDPKRPSEIHRCTVSTV
jgi:hypothetical protein